MAPFRSHHGEQSAKLGTALITLSSLFLLTVVLLRIHVSQGLLITAAGISTIGLEMVMVALVRDRYRARWVFWFMLLYSMLLFINPPVGTVVAVTIMFFLLKNRRAFLNTQK